MTLTFHGSADPTIGVEIELQLLNPETLDLTPASESLLTLCKKNNIENIKSEIHQSMIEINSNVSSNVKECSQFLVSSFKNLYQFTDQLGLELGITGTHPFQKWEERIISNGERYQYLHDKYQWLIRRMNIYGLHVHVGISSGERALAISKSLTQYLPHLLALSANSPYWHGVDTGMNSTRISIMNSFPFAESTPHFENWRAFEHYYSTLTKCGVISSLKDIYWPIRPNLDFGTLEFRICDGISNLSDTMAIVAFIHCLVVWANENLNKFKKRPNEINLISAENQWVAARDGLEGSIITNLEGDKVKLSDSILQLVENLLPVSEKLNCKEELLSVKEIVAKGNGAQRQREIYHQTNSFKAIIDRSINELKEDLVGNF